MSNDQYYLGNPKIKRQGSQHGYTEKEVQEYLRCMKDPVYFAENYVKIVSIDEGLQQFKPYPYQKDLLRSFDKERFNIVLACRQSGKSISSIVYILWYACFNTDKDIAILANKGATSREMLARIILALENLPFFLQPGCKVLNKGSVEFANNCRIFAAATSASSIRGLSVSLLFLDEFAFVENAETFYTSTYPVISSGKKSKVIITSTQNGTGTLYYKILEAALQGTNNFVPTRIDWWDVPGRDEKWKAETIANTSEEQFRQEFENEAIGSSNTLISANTLLGLKAHAPREIRSGVQIYELPKQNTGYLLMVDVGRGRGQDYSTFNIIDVTARPFKQVATFRDNKISPLIFPDIIVKFAKIYNEAIVLIENNDAGQVVCNTVYYEYEYENTFVESSVKRGGIGITMTSRVKRIGCSHLKDLIEMGKLQIVDRQTVSELAAFEIKGSSYQAAQGNHDDLVMNLVLFSWFISSEAFGDISDQDLRDIILERQIAEAEEDLAPVGIFPGGARDNSSLEVYYNMVDSKKQWEDL